MTCVALQPFFAMGLTGQTPIPNEGRAIRSGYLTDAQLTDAQKPRIAANAS